MATENQPDMLFRLKMKELRDAIADTAQGMALASDALKEARKKYDVAVHALLTTIDDEQETLF